MKVGQRSRCYWNNLSWLSVVATLIAGIPSAKAQEAAPPATAATPVATPVAAEPPPKPRLSVYGFAMLDMGYQSGQNDPAWFDVVRPTKLPAFEDQFGSDGRFFAGVRQSRLGVRSYVPIKDMGELKTIFEFELFGTGVDAGQTTFRLRHAWGELGKFGAGQTWSPFMDPDVFPNSIEYWGPSGMVFYRNVQLRWTPLKDENSEFVIALERPGASADQGDFAGRIELEEVTGRFPLPDLSAHWRREINRGHIQVAGILREIKWDDNNNDGVDISGDALGWGVNVSTNLKILDKHVIRASFVYGEGIENYMNDAPVDVGIKDDLSGPLTTIEGVALPVLGIVAFIDLNWNEKWTSSVGYSMVDIDNSAGQTDDAFSLGHYALGNVLYHPTADLFMGPELQWGKRENFRDGFSSDDFRVQFSVKYSFKHDFGG